MKRGRPSSASLEIAAVVTLPGQRMAPPDELTDEQAAEWKAIVADKPAEWFTRATRSMLVNHCRHIVMARRVAEQIDAFPLADLANTDGLKRYAVLGGMLEQHSRTTASLATRMRLTQQATYTPGAASTASKSSSGAAKPWEFGKAG